jgi:hypothetical protein
VTAIKVTDEAAAVMLRAVLEANRDLYRSLEAERATIRELRLKVHRLQGQVNKAKADRDLWRVRATRDAA